ncbi:MAG: RDD family protein [Bacteroidales bacterium]|nr:RDD family protein [Bacteroidales bacterium]
MENQNLNPENQPKYAGFWLRLVAIIIDGLIIGAAKLIIIGPFLAVIGITAARDFSDMKQECSSSACEIVSLIGPLVGAALIANFIVVIISWLYFALMESSARQATIGKMALGIIVTNMNGEKVNFGQATGRYFGKIISGIILCVGYIMAGFTEKKQALHDIMANCLVIKK